MRTITQEVDIYKFDELTDNAKWHVVAWLNQHLDFSDEYKSLAKFCEWFGIKTRINFDNGYWHSGTTTTDGYAEQEELCGRRLYAWLMNNIYDNLLVQPKEYGKRKSRIVKVQTICPLSGFYMDEDLLDPIRKFLLKPTADVDFLSLMNKCLDRFCKTLQAEYDYRNSFEYAEMMCETSEYEFYENGALAVA